MSTTIDRCQICGIFDENLKDYSGVLMCILCELKAKNGANSNVCDPMLENLRQRFMQPKFISLAELLDNPEPPQPLIKGVLDAQSLAALVGPSGEAKSFVRTTLEMAVATGMDWNGHPVKRRGHVLRMLGEGYAGEIGRSLAHLRHHGLTIDDTRNVHVSTQTLSMNGDNVDEIIEEVKQMGVDVAFITIDTVHRHLEGDENSAKDMGEFIRAADRLREELNATVLLVHHSGHDKSRARGSSSFYAALDTEIFCNQGRLVFTKTKNSEPPQPIDFKLRPVQIGIDEDGEPVSSCVVQWGERSLQSKLGDLTHNEQTLLQIVDANPGELIGDIRRIFYSKRRETDPEAKNDTLKKTFSRALDGIMTKGFKRLEGNYVVGGQGTKGDISGHCPPVDGRDEGGTFGDTLLRVSPCPPPCPPNPSDANSGWKTKVPPWQR